MRFEKSMQIFVFLISLSGCAFAADLIPSFYTCFDYDLKFLTEFGSPILAAFSFMAFLIAGAYMLGTSWSKPELLVWSKTELVSLLWSALLAIAVIGSLGFSCTLSNLLLTGSPLTPDAEGAYSSAVSPSQVATKYIDTLLENYGASVASDILRSSIDDQLGTTGYAYWSIAQMGGGGISFNANRFAWSSHKEILADIYLPLASMLMAQKMIFEILMPGILGVLIPAAIFFRSIFLTRDVGNLMLAFSMAVFFAVPLTYVFFFDASANVQTEILNATPSRPFGANFNLGYDSIIGDKMQKVGFVATQAILPLNIALVITTALTMALSKAFKGMVG